MIYAIRTRAWLTYTVVATAQVMGLGAILTLLAL